MQEKALRHRVFLKSSALSLSLHSGKYLSSSLDLHRSLACIFCTKWSPRPDSNRHEECSPTDFKSVVSAIPPLGVKFFKELIKSYSPLYAYYICI